MPRPQSFTHYCLLSAIVALLLCGISWAQLPTATLNGIVTDPKGAVVPAAHVTLTSTATAQKREANTSSAGAYVFTSLAPGSYDLHVEAPGFGARAFKGI